MQAIIYAENDDQNNFGVKKYEFLKHFYDYFGF